MRHEPLPIVVGVYLLALVAGAVCVLVLLALLEGSSP